MGFQSTVRQFQADGIVGDIVIDGPRRGQTGVLKTTDPTQNVIGRALTHVSGQDKQFVAGGTGVFAGILANSKEYALQGTAAGGALAPTITLPNELTVDAITMTSGIVVSLAGAANIGDQVEFKQATGALNAIAPGASATAGSTIIPRARVVRNNVPSAGLAIIELTV